MVDILGGSEVKGAVETALEFARAIKLPAAIGSSKASVAAP
jgi:hypothetical protein